MPKIFRTKLFPKKKSFELVLSLYATETSYKKQKTTIDWLLINTSFLATFDPKT